MTEICTLYEAESESDTDEARAERFQKIVMALQFMQSLGQPPSDLVGELPPGWSIDPGSGLPTVQDQQQAVDSCSIM